MHRVALPVRTPPRRPVLGLYHIAAPMPTAMEASRERAHRPRYLELQQPNSPLNHGLQPLGRVVLSRAPPPVLPNRSCPLHLITTARQQTKVAGVRPGPPTAYPALPRMPPLGLVHGFGAVANRTIGGGAFRTRRSRNVRPRTCWACKGRSISCSTSWRSLTRAEIDSIGVFFFFLLSFFRVQYIHIFPVLLYRWG